MGTLTCKMNISLWSLGSLRTHYATNSLLKYNMRLTTSVITKNSPKEQVLAVQIFQPPTHTPFSIYSTIATAHDYERSHPHSCTLMTYKCFHRFFRSQLDIQHIYLFDLCLPFPPKKGTQAVLTIIKYRLKTIKKINLKHKNKWHRQHPAS